MQTPDARHRANSIVRRMTLNDIQDEVLRERTFQILLTVPTVDIQTAFEFLTATNYHVEDSCWHILAQQIQKGYQRLQLNEMINHFTRSCVARLQNMFPESSTQECYVAITIAKGVLDDAVKHLQWMQKQKYNHGDEGTLGFLVVYEWPANTKPEW